MVREHEVLFAREVAKERPLRDARALADLLHGRIVIPTLGEQAVGLGEQRGSGLLLLLLPQTQIDTIMALATPDSDAYKRRRV